MSDLFKGKRNFDDVERNMHQTDQMSYKVKRSDCFITH